MILLKVLLSNLRTSYSLQIQRSSISSAASASSLNSGTLSSLFSETPSNNSPTSKPSSDHTLSSLFSAENSSKVSSSEKSSKNGKLLNKRKYKKEKKVEAVSKPMPREEVKKEFLKGLSPEMALFVSRLMEGGYLKDANLKLEPQQIPDNKYSRTFLRTAAQKFGRDHQEVAKWLSGSELKRVALFGCPTIEKNSVFAAKRLRAFFRIKENLVCGGCKLKTSCQFLNKQVGTMDKVVLEDVMRLLADYGLGAVPSELIIPEEVKCSINKLLNEIVSLSNS